eukprot:TRINITY_DN880_c0_g1_i2.p1 TRINITY_DN880_c0_g1~~TRINITY_DN880_c0_g1_i2.p1  ORF type:complete len:272 (-),score=82.63 TRINITY_DN880_c0_g1_i2:30-845(-)
MGSIHSWPFLYPVDPDAMMIPEYRDIIKEPMDFHTVKDNFEKGKYEELESFFYDVDLIFDNAKTFNPEGTDVYLHAEFLQSHFSDIKSKLNRMSGSEKEDKKEKLFAELEELKKTLETLTSQEKTLLEQNNKLSEREESLPNIRKKISRKKLTYEEKKEIHDRYKKLDKKFSLGVNMILRNTKFVKATDTFATIEIDVLDTYHARQLLFYLRDCEDIENGRTPSDKEEEDEGVPTLSLELDTQNDATIDQESSSESTSTVSESSSSESSDE